MLKIKPKDPEIRTKLRVLFAILLFSLFGENIFAQCTLNIPDDGCKTEIITFEAVTSNTVLSASWTFGDGSSSNQIKPFYQYNSTGTFTVSVTLNFVGGGSCTASKNITIHDLPQPDFSFDPGNKYCLDVNSIELVDASKSGISGGYIQSRLILWGDGSRTLANYPNIQSSETYSYKQSGIYDIDIELINNKGCKIKSKKQVTILPVYTPTFTVSNERFLCDTVEICVLNDSSTQPSYVNKVKWTWGDGTDTTGNFFGLCHIYTVSNTYRIELETTHDNGCKSVTSVVRNVVIPDLSLKPSMGKKRQCVNEKFTFIHPQRANVTYYWKITDTNNIIVAAKVGSVFSEVFIVPGKYYVELRAQNGECSKYYYDSIEVVGIHPILHLLNSNQCANKDTVYFNAYLQKYGTSNFKVLWDFGDSLAPQCTTKVNGTNYQCRYSNQVFARHKYDSQGCYQIKFWVYDIDNGCEWYEENFVTIHEINSNEVSYEVKKKCVGTHPDFTFRFKVPDCLADVKMNYDSACNKDLWVEYSEFKIYGFSCGDDGWVTVGFKMSNGDAKIFRSNDTLDFYIDSARICNLEFWKHNWFRLNPAPDAVFWHAKDSCPPSPTTVHPYFQEQPIASRVEIDWSDGNFDIYNLDKSKDSIGHFSHVFLVSGVYPILMRIYSDSGCYGQWVDTLVLGHFSSFTYDPVVCPGKEIVLDDDVHYWFDDTKYWRSSSRRQLGYELIKWDLGDGNGFSFDKPQPKVKFPSPGNYTIKMATKDINNCWDTVKTTIGVSGILAGIKPITKKIVCDDIIQFFDSTDLKQFSGLDSIKNYSWDFGDSKQPSYLKNPFHYYSSYGNFLVTHAVQTLSGCTDTARVTVFIGGPIPHFVIKDTMGCAPFTAQFVNQSKTVSKYIWYFGDASSSTYSTSKDTQVNFTYNQPGIYDIYLFGSDSVINPDNQNKVYYCSAWFPDSSSAFPPLRRVVVLPKPKADFTLDEHGCTNKLLNLRSLADPIYSTFNWKLNNDSFTAYSSDTSVAVRDTGVLKIVFSPTYQDTGIYNLKCFDTAVRFIKMHEIAASFTKLKGEKCNEYSFTSTSKNAITAKWRYLKDGVEIGTSSGFNPPWDFKTEKGIVDICLKISDSFGCDDEWCDTLGLQPNAFKLILPNVFTPGTDGKNDAFDIDAENHSFYRLTIFNRWGEIVYQNDEDGIGNDEINWNGNYMNSVSSPMPDGAYFYLLEIKEQCNPDAELQKISGTVTLIREK